MVDMSIPVFPPGLKVKEAMKLRTAKWWLLILLLGSFTSACGSDCVEVNGGETFRTALTLENREGIETEVFQSGEPVIMKLSVENLTCSTQSLTMPSGQRYEFLVAEGLSPDNIIWRWTENCGCGFIQAVMEMGFYPREAKVFAETWDQTGIDNSPVPTGIYNAQGFIANDSEKITDFNTPYITAPTETRSEPVIITITP